MSEISVESSRPAASAGRSITVANSQRLGISVLVLIAFAVRLNYLAPVLISGVKLSGDALYRYHAIAQREFSVFGASA